MTIRAVRNNNPGNIDKGQPWQGLMAHDKMNPEQAAEPRFCVFETPAWGFRAMFEVLMHYQPALLAQGKTYCVQNIIDRWAPPVENATGAYVAHVAGLTGFAPGRVLMPVGVVLKPLVKAISTHEVGSWAFTEADLQKGMELAGL